MTIPTSGSFRGAMRRWSEPGVAIVSGLRKTGVSPVAIFAPRLQPPGKPEVRRWADERYSPGRLDGIELVPAASVVDDDDLPVGPVGPDGCDAREQARA